MEGVVMLPSGDQVMLRPAVLIRLTVEAFTLPATVLEMIKSPLAILMLPLFWKVTSSALAMVRPPALALMLPFSATWFSPSRTSPPPALMVGVASEKIMSSNGVMMTPLAALRSPAMVISLSGFALPSVLRLMAPESVTRSPLPRISLAAEAVTELNVPA